ncbi:hypothetical protein LV779_26545 [Streptomyces thinghirensis]|nr:hypothetical protein [Streptomyces thinghirensis]
MGDVNHRALLTHRASTRPASRAPPSPPAPPAYRTWTPVRGARTPRPQTTTPSPRWCSPTPRRPPSA